MYGRMPELWHRLVGRIHKAISRRVIQWMSVHAERANGTDGQRAERRAAVDAYIREVLTTTGKVITRTHIWKKAGDKSRAEFERWESHWYEKRGRKPNRAANRRFTRILAEKPHLK